MTAEHTIDLRVRYSETDQLGTFYNSRALEWFEVGRTELLRSIGLPYTELESRGVFLPLVIAHVEYLGRAKYDDSLTLTGRIAPEGRARIRFDVTITHSDGRPVVRGHTVHAVTTAQGKPVRPPKWLMDALGGDPE